MRRNTLTLFVVLLVVGAVFPSPSFAGWPCESLAGLKLPHTTIDTAESVPAGVLRVENPLSPGYFFSLEVPAICRVTATIEPTTDSHIRFEVWMPSKGWNGRFDGIGNVAFGGFLMYGSLVSAVRAGFAVASTDTGHVAPGNDASWAVGHPEKVKDFGYRSVHLMTEVSKEIVRDFYGHPPDRSYFIGCSTGGRQALMEAQRFPDDYDGIIAGAPAIFQTHFQSYGIWIAQATIEDPASYIPANKLALIHNAVVAACDTLDNVRDGILNDPRQCHFNPKALLCGKADSDRCLTSPQVAALAKIYAGPHNSEGKAIFPGFMPGSELGWSDSVAGPAPGKAGRIAFGEQFFSNMVFGNPKWDFRTFNFDRDVRVADARLASILNATNPDLAAFKARGGKLILFHGWADAEIPPLNTVNYFKSVEARLGQQQTQSFVHLYMVPGMGHCGGGTGPDSFGWFPVANPDPGKSIFGALEQWVEHGVAPQAITATKYAKDMDASSGVEMTRPLCPFPEVARYKGSGDIHDAANFVCTSGSDKTATVSRTHNPPQ